MTTLTTTASKAITVPGALFTHNALTIAADASPNQLQAVGAFLFEVGSSLDWWRADYVHAVSARNAPERVKEGDDPNAKARAMCEEQGMEQGTFYFYCSVGEIFPPSERIYELSFEHHKEAIQGANGEPKKAREWLKKALVNHWDVSALRMAMRHANAEYHPDGKKPTGNGYSALLDANRWASTQAKQLDTYTPERATAILGDVQPLRAFIAKLEAIASGQ